MGKGKGLTFTLFAALGAMVGYASYMARENEFSEETKDKYDVFLNKAKNVGSDLQRTYTTIGDKKKFTESTKDLSESAKKLASKASDLVLSATSDMYKNAKAKVSDALGNANYGELVKATVSNKSVKKVTKKTPTKKTVKKKK